MLQLCHRLTVLMLVFCRCDFTKIGKISTFANLSSFLSSAEKKSTCGTEKGRCSGHGSVTLFCLWDDRIGVVSRPVSKVCFGLVGGRLGAECLDRLRGGGVSSRPGGALGEFLMVVEIIEVGFVCAEIRHIACPSWLH